MQIKVYTILLKHVYLININFNINIKEKYIISIKNIQGNIVGLFKLCSLALKSIWKPLSVA